MAAGDRGDSVGLEKIPFNRPAIVGRELYYISRAIVNGSIAGGGPFSRLCEEWLERELPAERVLLTHSCTAALELAAILSEVGLGDEVILPSFTFASTATAFVLRGATPVFVDIRADTLNLDERLIEEAVTPHTRVIVPVHYGGYPCAMDAIDAIAARCGALVVEDAAQAHLSEYEGRALGTIGALGCISFHETKNIISGEGGALIVNEGRFIDRAEIVREKGTNRGRFFRGEVDKYTWVDIGSSYSPSEIVGAFLYAQLERAEEICTRRRAIYDLYRYGLQSLSERGDIVIPTATGAETNGHVFWILLQGEATRAAVIEHLKGKGISAVFHYVPLHSSPAGRRAGRTGSPMTTTDDIAARLLRLPLYLEMTDAEVERVIAALEAFFGKNS